MAVWICDVNGVLVDTVSAVRGAFAAVAAQGGFAFSDADFQRIKGLPLLEAYRHLAPGSDPAAWRQLHLRSIRDRLPHVTAYAEVAEVLAAARASGVRLGATTSHGEIAEGCLVRTGLYAFFDCLVTQEEVSRPKPHPDSILRVLDLFGVDPRQQAEDVVFVGDTVEDIQAGRTAGVRAIGVTYGISDEHEIRGAHPDRVIHAFGEMRAFLANVPRLTATSA